MQPLIVLDKSYLRGATGNEVRDLCERTRALMPEDLFFELLTGDFETRTRCFQKLPRRDNPVELLPNVGSLLRYEVENQRPTSPIWDHRIRMVYEFNQELAGGTFELTEQQRAGVEEWERHLTESVESLIERGNIADRVFTDLQGVRPGQEPNLIEEIVAAIASNIDMMSDVYGSYSPDHYPPTALVDYTWTLFRWYQAQWIGVVEYFGKYGPGLHAVSHKKLENEVCDLNYLVVGVMAGGLATRDRPMARRFRVLCPEGELLS